MLRHTFTVELFHSRHSVGLNWLLDAAASPPLRALRGGECSLGPIVKIETDQLITLAYECLTISGHLNTLVAKAECTHFVPARAAVPPGDQNEEICVLDTAWCNDSSVVVIGTYVFCTMG